MTAGVRGARPAPAQRRRGRPVLEVLTDRRARRPGVVVPRGRLMALLVVLVLAFSAVVARLTFVQGVTAAPYAALGLSERVHAVVLPADRGSILDRDGNELAMSVPQSTVWADPRLVTSPAPEAQALAPVLGLTTRTVMDRITRPGSFSYVARTVDDATAAAVRALALPGINLIAESRRFDPDGTLAGPVVGTVGTDELGLSGLEHQYEAVLTGHAGKLVSEDDPSGKPIPGGVSRLTPATRGSDLVLSLDRALQFEVEQDLAAAIISSKAKAGTAVVMDVHTGEVLAMAGLVSAPDGSGPAVSPANLALTSVFEPGSVQKLITLSAALEEGAVRASDTLTVGDQVRVADATFADDTPHPTERWSPTDVLTASSNVGAIAIGRSLGKAGLVSYLHQFGFGSRTTLAFPGESAGLLLDPARWSGTTIATVPIGQGIAATVMQVAAAYNAIANGGVYVAPKLVTATVGPGGRRVPTPPSPTHRVVSPDVARQMTAMLTEVVRKGTGTAAAIDGYEVAGKTGTARKAVEGAAGYKAGAYDATFAGFVPATAPSFTTLVMLDEPTPIYGGLVAAPVFRAIATYALRERQVPPPPPDPRLFDGVPHAQASAASAVDEPPVPTPAAAPAAPPATPAGAGSATAPPAGGGAGPAPGPASPAGPGATTGPTGTPGKTGRTGSIGGPVRPKAAAPLTPAPATP